jgi:DNA-binding transcriptional MerR regulator
MMWTIPGTVLQANRMEAAYIPQQLEALFFGGGIALSQVTSITGLEAYTVQNWVKRGFLPPPEHRRYSMRQVCRIIHINMLKSILSLETVCSLLQYINGKLDDTADDIIDDAQLYFLFVKLAARAKQLDDTAAWEQAMAEALVDYREPFPGAKERIEKALRVMLTAWIAARMRQAAEQMLRELS